METLPGHFVELDAHLLGVPHLVQFFYSLDVGLLLDIVEQVAWIGLHAFSLLVVVVTLFEGLFLKVESLYSVARSWR